MKIGFLGPFGSECNSDYGSDRQVGAIEHQIFGLARELSKLGHELFVTRNWKGSEIEDVIEGIHFINANFMGSIEQGFYYSRFPLNRLAQVNYFLKSPIQLRRQNVDILNLSEVLPGWIALKNTRKSDCRKVFITHNNDVYVGEKKHRNPMQFASKRMLTALNHQCDATVAVSIGTKQYLESIGSNCRTLIPEAIDPSVYFGGKDGNFLLTGGRLVKHKKIEDLLKVYSRLKNHSLPLVIVGEGQQKSFLLRTARVLNIMSHVNFVPFLPKSEYRRILSSCSIFIFPSQAEVFGVAVLEAMASGKPVIARRVTGPKDIITHAYDGFLFDNERELGEYMELLQSDSALRKRIGQNARKTVEEKYSFTLMARKYEKLYNSLF